MAKLPLPDHDGVKPYDGAPYEPNAICAAPGCDQPSQDPHHMWRRSFLGGAYDWVLINDLMVVGNVVGLCRHHHDQVEAGSAWITLEDSGFCWTGMLTATERMLWQPPMLPLAEMGDNLTRAGASPISASGEGVGTRGSGDEEPVPVAPDLAVPRDTEEDSHGLTPRPLDVPAPLTNGHDPTVCPSCKRPLPQPKIEGPMEEARPRRSWTVTVPMDQRENGAAILDELLEAARELMAGKGLIYSDSHKAKFNVLSTQMALFVQHFEEVFS